MVKNTTNDAISIFCQLQKMNVVTAVKHEKANTRHVTHLRNLESAAFIILDPVSRIHLDRSNSLTVTLDYDFVFREYEYELIGSVHMCSMCL